MSNRWEVFGKRTADDAWTAVGAVHAPDEDMALLFAKESFFRHGEGVDFAVVRTRDFHAWGDPDLLAFHTDKTYKLQRGYPLGEKRRRATELVRAAGLAIDRPRPAGRRPDGNPDGGSAGAPPGEGSGPVQAASGEAAP